MRLSYKIQLVMKLLPNIHPGEVLRKEFLTELNLTAYRLAQDVGIPKPASRRY